MGGGPGDPGLLTVRGRHLLAGADVVVADRLGPTDLLPALAEHAEIIDVGKRAGYHKVTQDRINQTLVDQARAGRRVVRLKGGDPYVFGRGGEEVEFCHAHGIATEVVPGVTSAISVPAAAGIPVTHRDMAHGFTVITAHEELRHVPYREGHTLILMMGVRGLARTAETLLAARYPRDLPVAVVERGWTPTQRTTLAPLADVARTAEERGVRAPGRDPRGPGRRPRAHRPAALTATVPCCGRHPGAAVTAVSWAEQPRPADRPPPPGSGRTWTTPPGALSWAGASRARGR